jgi:hypothetical protein
VPGVDNEQRLVDGARCRLHLLDLERRRCVIRVDDKGDRAGLRQKFTHESETLWPKFGREQAHTGGVAAGPVEAGDEAKLQELFRDELRGNPSFRKLLAKWFATS